MTKRRRCKIDIYVRNRYSSAHIIKIKTYPHWTGVKTILLDVHGSNAMGKTRVIALDRIYKTPTVDHSDAKADKGRLALAGCADDTMYSGQMPSLFLLLLLFLRSRVRDSILARMPGELQVRDHNGNESSDSRWGYAVVPAFRLLRQTFHGIVHNQNDCVRHGQKQHA